MLLLLIMSRQAIISTCQKWRRLGSEFLVRCLFFDNQTKLQQFHSVLCADPNLGWWTRRIHLTRYYSHTEGMTMDDMASTLIAIIQHCPNLEIFIINWPMGNAFGPIADALCRYCAKSLKTVHWHILNESLPKVIWALDSLKSLQAVHIEINMPTENENESNLGAASGLNLNLRHLTQLSLRGFCQEFIEQATGWSLPLLRSFSFDFDANTNKDDLPDITDFLTHHGTELIFLDLNCIPTLDTATILDLCPFLTTFTFNPDWFLPQSNPDSLSDTVTIVNRPHQSIIEIGCHGLLSAFGVGIASNMDSFRLHLLQRTNEKNIAALTKANFPALKKVRALSRLLLTNLETSNGPAADCYERWDKWWNQFSQVRVRLEDCTGAELGTLPAPLHSEEEDDEDDEDDESEEEEPKGAHLSKGALSELRDLLEECRKMSAEREELPTFLQFDMATMMLPSSS